MVKADWPFTSEKPFAVPISQRCSSSKTRKKKKFPVVFPAYYRKNVSQITAVTVVE